MTVGRRGMFVRELAMFDGRSRVLLRLFVLAEFVMMGGLMVMRCSVVVSGRLMVMLTRWMLQCLCHLNLNSSLRVNNRLFPPNDGRMTVQ